MNQLALKPETRINLLLSPVAAGQPLAADAVFDRIDLNQMLTNGNPYCVLVRVRGDSMDGEIADGDMVLIDRSRQPQPNDIVLAFVNGGYSVKRYKLNDRRGSSGLYLVPSNGKHEPRRLEPTDDFELVGVVTHVIHSTL